MEGIGECGRRCDKNKKCKSIEWSDSEKNCVLLTAESTDGPKWKDYRFCSKIKGKKYSVKICLKLFRNHKKNFNDYNSFIYLRQHLIF